MKNKLIALILALACLVCFAACGEDDGDKKDGAFDSFYISYNDVTLKLGDRADGVLEELGEAQSVTEIGNCGGLGSQVKYSYASIDLYVLEVTGGDSIIDQITFRDDIVTTPEGVYLGMSLDEAKELLGEPTSETDKAALYSDGTYTLKLSIVSGVITEINYITN